MKKAVTVLVIVVVGLLLLVAAGLAFLYMNRNEVLRQATERTMTYVLQVDVTVEGAELDIQNGIVGFTNVTIPNPEGFDGPHAMKFGNVRVEADIASFRTDTAIINLIQIDDPDIVFEQQSLQGDSNLQVLTDNAMRLSDPDAPPPPDEEAGKQMIIERLVIERTQVGVTLPFTGGQTQSIQLPRIEAEDLGGAEDETVTPAEAVQEFMALILAEITSLGQGILPAEILNDLAGTLQNLPADLQQNLENLTGQLPNIEGATGEAQRAVEDVTGEAERAAERAGQEAQRAADEATGALRRLLGGQQNDENE